MKLIDALAALSIAFLFAPVLTAQYLRADETWRKAIGMLRTISETKERIRAIEEGAEGRDISCAGGGFRIGEIRAEAGEKRDAVFFNFEGKELHWILGR